MRLSVVVTFVALLLPACLVGQGEIEGGGPGDDQGTGSGIEGGGGTGTPRISGSVDKASINTELGKTERIMLTVSGSGGFSGTVAVAPTVVDLGGNAAAGFVATANPSSVSIPLNGSAVVQVDVQVATDVTVLAPNIKLDLSSGTLTANAASALAIANQVTILLPSGTGTAAPHAGWPAKTAPIRIHVGAKLVFHNADGIQHVIHADGGIPHENTGAGLPGTDYTVTPSDSATWYCHDHEGSGSARAVNLIP